MRWGFIGTGRIAERIMEAFALLPESQVVAVCGRNRQAMEAFCHKWNIAGQYDSIEELANAPEVDILYLATPHIVHQEHFIKAAAAGKPILCEKPMAMSAAETRQMVMLAKERKIFLMEGLWNRFFPIYDWLAELMDAGIMGTAYNVMADFSYHSPYQPDLRFFRKDLGGGSMRGAGVYPLSLAMMLFHSPPCEILAMADTKAGVDLRSAALLRFPGGEMAQILSGFQGESVQGANFAFAKGSVWIPDFWHPDKAILKLDGRTEIIERPFAFPGFQFEIEHVEACVRAGKTESDRMTWQESIELAEALDEMYRQWDVPAGKEEMGICRD